MRGFAATIRSPSALVGPIHHRMPMILTPIAWRAWRGEEAASEEEFRAPLAVYLAALMPPTPSTSGSATCAPMTPG